MSDQIKSETESQRLAQVLRDQSQLIREQWHTSPEFKFGQAIVELIETAVDRAEVANPERRTPLAALLRIARVIGVRNLFEAKLAIGNSYRASRIERGNPERDERRRQRAEMELTEHFVCGVIDFEKKGIHRPDALRQAAIATYRSAQRDYLDGEVVVSAWYPPGSTRQLQRRFRECAERLRARGSINDPLVDALQGRSHLEYSLDDLSAKRGPKAKFATSAVKNAQPNSRI